MIFVTLSFLRLLYVMNGVNAKCAGCGQTDRQTASSNLTREGSQRHYVDMRGAQNEEVQDETFVETPPYDGLKPKKMANDNRQGRIGKEE